MWLAIGGYACVALAWWRHRKTRTGGVGEDLLLLALAAGFLRLSASLDPGLHEWDERYHALVAKHLLHDPLTPMLYADPNTPHEEGSWAHGHIWLNKPPLSLWAMAASLKLFGLQPWAVRLPSALLSACATALLFLLGRSLLTRRAAFWAAVLFAINGHLIELASGRTSNDHPDTFLLCFVLAALYATKCMVRTRTTAWSLLAGLFLGLAFMSKSWPALIVLPVACCWAWTHGNMDRRLMRNMALIMAMAIAVALPWSLYATQAFPTVSGLAGESHWRHFTSGLEDHARPWTYYLAQLPMLHGELAPLAILFFIAGPFRSDPRRHLALLLWCSLPYLVFSAAVTKMPAYVVIAAPALFLMIGSVVDQWSQVMGAPTAIRYLARAGAVLLVVLPLKFSVERLAPWKAMTKAYTIPARFHYMEPRTVVVDCPWPIELMFHTPVIAAYDHKLPMDALEQLEAEGYSIVRFTSN